ncbi:MAG: DUF1839 family protein [Candidatus Limnocylindria bacterium]
MSTSVHLFGHDPATYRPHAVHAEERTYHETNCYTDLLIELLHAHGDEPLAALGSNVRMDFEGDQWTFFKPSPSDIESLFGVDIHEMQPYRPLPVQIAELLGQRRTLTVEMDAWYLPDTVATSYRTEHVKSSIAAEAIDLEGERLRYYHNTSLYELEGEDYRGVFRIGSDAADALPPYAELVRFDAGRQLVGEELRAASLGMLREHLAKLPTTNPFPRFGERLEADLPTLLAGDVNDYHAYAFATVRMAGAGFELTASHVDWLLGPRAENVSSALGRIVDGSKLLGFKLARRRPFDAEPIVSELAAAWDEAMTALARAAR